MRFLSHAQSRSAQDSFPVHRSPYQDRAGRPSISKLKAAGSLVRHHPIAQGQAMNSQQSSLADRCLMEKMGESAWKCQPSGLDGKALGAHCLRYAVSHHRFQLVLTWRKRIEGKRSRILNATVLIGCG